MKVVDQKIYVDQNHPGGSENIYESLTQIESLQKTEPTDQYVEMSTPLNPKPIVDVDFSPVSPDITIEKISHEDCQMTVTSNESDVLDSSYEIVEHEEVERPSLLLENKSSEETSKSVKDRMFLSTDDAAATLLFTQTVTSPMLTPSEENIDFLKGFQRDVLTSESTNSNDSPQESNKISQENSTRDSSTAQSTKVPPFQGPKDIENVYENAEFLKNKIENIYENLKDCKNLNDNIYENVKEVKNIHDEVTEHEEHIYQDIEDCKKEGVYEEVSNIKIITSQMISDEIMVENSLYNNVDELKLRQIEDMITDLDSAEGTVDSDKMYESIATGEEISVDCEHYDTISTHTEIVTSEFENVSQSKTVITQGFETNQYYHDTLENISEVSQNHKDVTESTHSPILSNSKSAQNESQCVSEKNKDHSSGVQHYSDTQHNTDNVQTEIRSISDDKAHGDGSKIYSNNGPTSDVSDLDINDKLKESYSEFVHHSKTESNYYEKYTKVVSNSTKNAEISNREKDTETVPAEIVKILKSQFSKTPSEVCTPSRKDVEDTNELRTINIMKHINKFEKKDCSQTDEVSSRFFTFLNLI